MTAKKKTKTAPKATPKAKTKAAAKAATKTADQSATTQPATTATETKSCLCGCGGTTGGGRFIPGHDAKLASALLAAFRSEDGLSTDQQALVGQLEWETKVMRPAPAKKPRTAESEARRKTIKEAALLLKELAEAHGPLVPGDQETVAAFLALAGVKDHDAPDGDEQK